MLLAVAVAVFVLVCLALLGGGQRLVR
jgi:hypothetical protein